MEKCQNDRPVIFDTSPQIGDLNLTGLCRFFRTPGIATGARRGKLFLSRRRSFFANHSRFDLSPIKSYSPISVPRCDPRARPVVTARELQPTIWIDKVFFPRSVRGNYWSPGREEQNAGLISKIGRAVWEIRGPIDFGSYGAPNRP